MNRKQLATALEPLTQGVFKNNATFRLVLGTCPTLAVTTAALNGLSMGLATMFVLVCSNAIISMLRNFIPRKVRIPAYILVIAAFSTLVQMIMRKFLPDMYETLGLFLSLVVVNCILLARAESFASLNPVLPSVLDGLGIGLGFTFSLTLMGFIRELLGTGAVFGYSIEPIVEIGLPMTIFVLPAGGFMVYGFMMVIFNAAVKAAENALNARKAARNADAADGTKIDEVEKSEVADTENADSGSSNSDERHEERSAAEGGAV